MNRNAVFIAIVVCSFVRLNVGLEAWNERVAITNLASGNNVLFATAFSKWLILRKAAVNERDQAVQPIAATQSFTASPGWPTGAFTLKVLNQYVVNAGAGRLALNVTATGKNGTWVYDSRGRLVSSADGWCIGVLSAALNVRLTLVPCASAGGSARMQQWVFAPSTNPPSRPVPVGSAAAKVRAKAAAEGGVATQQRQQQQYSSTFNGQVSSLDPSYSQRMCLEGVPPMDAGNGDVVQFPPSLRPCDAANPNQRVSTLPNPSDAASNWPSDTFRLYFPALDLCATLYDMGMGLALGRDTVHLVLVNCSLGLTTVPAQPSSSSSGSSSSSSSSSSSTGSGTMPSRLPMAAGTTDVEAGLFNGFVWNARGQLVGTYKADGSEAGAGLAICLKAGDGPAPVDVEVADCSVYQMKNRWLFTPGQW